MDVSLSPRTKRLTAWPRLRGENGGHLGNPLWTIFRPCPREQEIGWSGHAGLLRCCGSRDSLGKATDCVACREPQCPWTSWSACAASGAALAGSQSSSTSGWGERKVPVTGEACMCYVHACPSKQSPEVPPSRRISSHPSRTDRSTLMFEFEAAHRNNHNYRPAG